VKSVTVLVNPAGGSVSVVVVLPFILSNMIIAGATGNNVSSAFVKTRNHVVHRAVASTAADASSRTSIIRRGRDPSKHLNEESAYRYVEIP